MLNIFVEQNLEDNVGVFGDFKITRNVTTEEGCTVCCKYRIHYDKLTEKIQFVGQRQGVRCVKQEWSRISHYRTIILYVLGYPSMFQIKTYQQNGNIIL